MKTQLGPPLGGFTMFIDYKDGEYVLSERDDFSPQPPRQIGFSPNEAEVLVNYLTEQLEKNK